MAILLQLIRANAFQRFFLRNTRWRGDIFPGGKSKQMKSSDWCFQQILWLFLKTTFELQLTFKLKFHKYQVRLCGRCFQSSVNTVRKGFRQMSLPFSPQFHKELKQVISPDAFDILLGKNSMGTETICERLRIAALIPTYSVPDNVCIVPSAHFSFYKRYHPPACERQLVCGTVGKKTQLAILYQEYKCLNHHQKFKARVPSWNHLSEK